MQNHLPKFLAVAAVAASLSVMAGAQTVKTTITFPFGTQGVTVNPVTNTIYAVAPNQGILPTDGLGVINGKNDTLTATLTVPSGSLYATVDYFTNRVFVAGCDTTQTPSPCTVTVIDGKTNKTVTTVPVTTTPGFGLTGIVANPVTGLVYIANGSDRVVNILNSYTNKLAGTIDLQGNQPIAIAINPILNRLYIPFGTDVTTVVDAGSRKIIADEVFGNSTVDAAVNPITGDVFVTDQEAFEASMTGVLKYNGALVASPTVDDSPLGVDVDPITNLVFVASTATNTIDVIDGRTNSVKTSVPNVPANFVAVNFATEKVYVTGITGVTVLTEK